MYCPCHTSYSYASSVKNKKQGGNIVIVLLAKGHASRKQTKQLKIRHSKQNLTKAKTLPCGFYHLNPHLISNGTHTHKKEQMAFYLV